MVLGPAGDPELEGCRRGAGPGDTLDAAALARRFPGLRPRAGDVALWDGSGGVLRADRALRAVQVGATVGTGTGDRVGVPISVPAATSRCPHPGRVSPARGHAARRGEGAEHPARCCAHRHHHRRGVPSPPAHHRGRSLDQCPAGTAGAAPAAAGEGWWHRAAARPWARLTRCPPPQPLRIDVCYWREKEPGSYSAGTATPCFMALGLPEAPHGIYGLPALEYPGLVKVSGARWWGHRVFPPVCPH